MRNGAKSDGANLRRFPAGGLLRCSFNCFPCLQACLGRDCTLSGGLLFQLPGDSPGPSRLPFGNRELWLRTGENSQPTFAAFRRKPGRSCL
jgi:hypothetical protein